MDGERSMTKSELIELIAAKQSHLPAKDVELAVKQILEIMSDALAQGQRIEIRGFGSFSLHFRPPRQGRNPKTGETVALAGKYVPHFKPGKDLRERVNDPLDDDRSAEPSLAAFDRARRAAASRIRRRPAAAPGSGHPVHRTQPAALRVDVAFARFAVSSGLALLIAFAAGLLAGALWRSHLDCAAARGARPAAQCAASRRGASPPARAAGCGRRLIP